MIHKIFTVIFLLSGFLVYGQQNDTGNQNTKLDSSKYYSYQTILDSTPYELRKYSYSANEEVEIQYNFEETMKEWEPDKKIRYQMNESGLLLEKRLFYWDGVSLSWVAVGKFEYEYNSAGKRTLYKKTEYNENTQEWETILKQTYAYNSDNQRTLKINYDYDSSGSETPVNKIEWQYNNDGLLTVKTFYDYESGGFISDEKVEYEYNSDGKKATQIESYWSEAFVSWQLNIKYEFTYNDQMLLTDKTKYFYDLLSGWNAETKESFGYNSQELKTLHIEYLWSDSEEDFIPDWKYEWTYDDTTIVNYHSYEYDKQANRFENWRKTAYDYNANNLQTMKRSHEWDTNNSEWDPFTLERTSYNQYGNKTMISYYNGDESAGGFTLSTRKFNYYKDISAVPHYKSNISFKAYPNPASDKMSFSADIKQPEKITISIYNASGKVVHRDTKEQYAPGNIMRWNVANIPSGIYTAVIKTNEQEISHKVMVR